MIKLSILAILSALLAPQAYSTITFGSVKINMGSPQVTQGAGNVPGPGWRLRGSSAIPESEYDDVFDPINFGTFNFTSAPSAPSGGAGSGAHKVVIGVKACACQPSTGGVVGGGAGAGAGAPDLSTGLAALDDIKGLFQDWSDRIDALTTKVDDLETSTTSSDELDQLQSTLNDNKDAISKLQDQIKNLEDNHINDTLDYIKKHGLFVSDRWSIETLSDDLILKDNDVTGARYRFTAGKSQIFPTA